ncbi:MAG TPA: hypothetical protein PKM78_13270 [Anaerolineae bacterium]|nr:hypothetical protein [Anaerolineae bacterium]HNU05848.1 hypothetical protein [Anaerolineae bacterium]
MAKKVRKPRSASPRTYGQAGPQPAQAAPSVDVVPAAGQVQKSAAAPAAPAVRAGKQVDLRAEYPYVGRDLRNLGLTAAAMFAVLVVLNLVLGFVR